jgi:hypothetical protein
MHTFLGNDRNLLKRNGSVNNGHRQVTATVTLAKIEELLGDVFLVVSLPKYFKSDTSGETESVDRRSDWGAAIGEDTRGRGAYAVGSRYQKSDEDGGWGH